MSVNIDNPILLDEEAEMLLESSKEELVKALSVRLFDKPDNRLLVALIHSNWANAKLLSNIERQLLEMNMKLGKPGKKKT